MRKAALALAITAALCALGARFSAGQGGEPFKGTRAYCYFRPAELTWRIGNDVVERTVRFDRDTGVLFTQGVQVKGRLPRIEPVAGLEGQFLLAGDAPAVRLDGGWTYMWQIVTTPAHGGRLLTIHLQGKGRNAGYEVEALYEVYPGNRPYLARSLTLINRSGAPRTVAEVDYGRWVLAKAPRGRRAAAAAAPVAPSAQPAAAPNVGVVQDPAGGGGLVAAVLGPGGTVAVSGGAVALRVKAAVDVSANGGRAYAPRAVVAPFLGAQGAGRALVGRLEAEIAH
ncbi:MAG: hypothetical protein IT208_04720 [Chthonomonadales bacterium]|nr:hypothetical protein [Chthonomonadales bacterium]